MNTYKYRLVEQKEQPQDSGPGSNKSQIDISIDFINSTPEEAAKAFGDINNYGQYISSMRNQKDIETIISDYFGPSNPITKKKLEKENGKPFPIKTKQAIDSLIKQNSLKPKLLKWEIKGNDMIFPASINPSKVQMQQIIDVVMKNAGIKYNLKRISPIQENKENINLTNEIRKAINLVDESLSYVDLAKSIAEILKEDYGTHNIKPFMEVLHKSLSLTK